MIVKNLFCSPVNLVLCSALFISCSVGNESTLQNNDIGQLYQNYIDRVNNTSHLSFLSCLLSVILESPALHCFLFCFYNLLQEGSELLYQCLLQSPFITHAHERERESNQCLYQKINLENHSCDTHFIIEENNTMLNK